MRWYFMALLVIAVFGAWEEQAWRHCNDAGGVQVQTILGFVCVKSEVMP